MPRTLDPELLLPRGLRGLMRSLLCCRVKCSL